MPAYDSVMQFLAYHSSTALLPIVENYRKRDQIKSTDYRVKKALFMLS